jgi:3-hydroxy-3-methylglutaryl CoA synthase
LSGLGISSFGAYVPRLRLDRTAIAVAHSWMAPSLRGLAKGSRAFTSWDEDAVTMAVEAGRDALRGTDPAKIASIIFASTRPPYADLQSSAIVAGALDLGADISSSDIGNSQRAGTSGLLQALRGTAPGLFVAADAPLGKPASTQEMTYGAGAAAFVLDRENVIATLVGSASVTANFVDHFRGAGERYDYFWEDRWIRDEAYLKLAPQAIKAALDKAGLGIGDIAAFAMPSLLRGGAQAVAKAIRFTGSVIDDLTESCGYAGAAHAPLMLAGALEQAKPGEHILVVGFGQGADALIFSVTDAIVDLAARRGVRGSIAEANVTDSYLRMLSFGDSIDLEWGMRSEKNAKTALTEQYRSANQIAAFKAGKCGACGTVQFPQLEYCVNPECHAPADQFAQQALVDAPAQVLTYTADWLSYHPAPPLYVGFVQFDNGARVLMEVVDVGPEGIDVGTRLKMVFRVKERDRARGYQRYFWKATPVFGAREQT